MFSKEDIHRLQMIQFYKEFHFPLDKIAIILEGSEKNRMEMMSIQLLEIQEQMRKYERIEKMLQAALCCQCSLPVQDKKETGTVVIGLDLQNDIKEGGALPCKRFYTLFQPLQNFYHRIRELQIPIIYLCDSHQRGKDKELEIWCDHMIEGTYGEKIIDELTPEKQDYVLKKRFFNGFVQTGLQKLLIDLKASRLIFTGWRTHVCVAQTAIEAFHRNYQVLIAVDGVNSTTRQEHEFGIGLMGANYGFEMYTCKELLEMLEKEQQLSS